MGGTGETGGEKTNLAVLPDGTVSVMLAPTMPLLPNVPNLAPPLIPGAMPLPPMLPNINPIPQLPAGVLPMQPLPGQGGMMQGNAGGIPGAGGIPVMNPTPNNTQLAGTTNPVYTQFTRN